MFQRLDKLRKNAFASVILFGGNNDSSISGVWVFRGQELVFPVSTFIRRHCPTLPSPSIISLPSVLLFSAHKALNNRTVAQ